MRGYPNYNYDAFHETAARWRAAGHAIISPAEQFGGDQTLPFPTYIKHDLGLILSETVQGVVVLPGWQQSEGATVEVTVARALRKPVYDSRYPDKLTLFDESIFEEAERLVRGDRNRQYGNAYEDFTQIGKVWSGILGVEVDPAKVGLCMAGLKLVREAYRPKRDNRVDTCGYMRCVDDIREFERQREFGWTGGRNGSKEQHPA